MTHMQLGNMADIQERAEAARKSLIAKGYIKWPSGSWHTWIEKEWAERYKHVLVNKNGQWIPSMAKLKELNELDLQYKDYQEKKAAEEFRQKANMKGIIDAHGEEAEAKRAIKQYAEQKANEATSNTTKSGEVRAMLPPPRPSVSSGEGEVSEPSIRVRQEEHKADMSVQSKPEAAIQGSLSTTTS